MVSHVAAAVAAAVQSKVNAATCTAAAQVHEFNKQQQQEQQRTAAGCMDGKVGAGMGHLGGTGTVGTIVTRYGRGLRLGAMTAAKHRSATFKHKV